MSRRLFFALWPDATVRDALVDIAVDPSLDPARGVLPQNLHLTVLFIGSAEPAVQRALEQGATSVCLPRFRLQLDQSGWWKPAQVAWLAPSRTPGPLQQLHDSLYRMALALDLKLDERAYRPHVTLARKQKRPVSLQFTPLCWEVNDFCLAESIPQTGYVEYRIIRRWALT